MSGKWSSGGRVYLAYRQYSNYCGDMIIYDDIHDDEAGVLCTCDHCRANGRCEDAPCCGCCT